MNATLNTELRKLRPAELYNLALILNLSDNWKKLMGSVRKDENGDSPKFSGECIAIVEQAARQERKLAASIFLEEWATMGRKRPTVGLLLDLLMETELFRAADYLAQDILKVAAPERPTSGPAAPVDIDAIANLLLRRNHDSESDSNNSNYLTQSIADIRLSEINYPSLVFDNENRTNDENSVVGANDEGVIEMNYAESRSNQVLGSAKVHVHPESSDDHRSDSKVSPNTNSTESHKQMSDLIKFSASGSQNLTEYSQSDLMKFDSEKLNAYEDIESSEAFMPDLNLLRLNSSSNSVSNANKNCVIGAIAEMRSAELPACLRSFGVSEKPSENVDNRDDRENSYFHRELVSAELPLCINDKITVDSNESNLSSNIRSEDDDSYSENSANVLSKCFDGRLSESSEVEKNVNSTDGIPCFVVDAKKREKIDEKVVIPKYESERNALNSQELPIMVLEFHKR